MSETHYWPTEPGTYLIAQQEGYDDEWSLGVDGKWSCEMIPTLTFTTAEMSDGYLGVRREKPKPEQAPDNAAIAAQALAEWRECKQSPKAADWAYKWAHRLCVMLGAE